MPNIYDLTGEFQMFSDIAEQGELTEEQAKMLDEALANLKEDIEYKLEGYCKVRANFKADIEAIKAEKERLDNKQKALENRVKTMENAMKTAILAIKPDDPKIKTSLFSLSVRNNQESTVIDAEDINLIPEAYLKYPKPTVDKDKIKEAIKAGKDLSGIAHLERTQSVIIK